MRCLMLQPAQPPLRVQLLEGCRWPDMEVPHAWCGSGKPAHLVSSGLHAYLGALSMLNGSLAF